MQLGVTVTEKIPHGPKSKFLPMNAQYLLRTHVLQLFAWMDRVCPKEDHPNVVVELDWTPPHVSTNLALPEHSRSVGRVGHLHWIRRAPGCLPDDKKADWAEAAGTGTQ
jgi:hypothetical protein